MNQQVDTKRTVLDIYAMKVLAQTPSLFIFNLCGEETFSQPSSIIQMEQMFDMGWEDVVEVKNCGDNRAIALEVIEGLNLVSQKYGRMSREYQIKP